MKESLIEINGQQVHYYEWGRNDNNDLHEWIPDQTFQYDGEQLQRLIKEYEEYDGVYPRGKTCLWESKESMRTRVASVLHKYLLYSYVIVVGHGMVIRSQVDVQNIDYVEII